MGNKETIPSNIQSLKEGTWVQAGQDQQNVLFSNVNPYRRRLLANIMTHQLIEEYELNFITEQDYNSYISELSYRQVKHSSYHNNSFSNKTDQGQTFIFPIRYFVNKSRHQMCTTIHTGYLYADKVDLRLKQINDIPFDDLLYMYKATLNGFKVLYEKVGYFDIVEEMIFITRRGEVKVWMNANLAKNYPNYDKNSGNNPSDQNTYSKKQHQNLYGSQADMIRKLILLIQKNSDQYEQTGEPQHQFFSQFLQIKNILDKLSFEHSLQEFQNYLHQNNLHCPQYMKSIPELFSPQDNNNNPTNYQLSHVNQITTQHLTQMKKTFQPMETIPQDQKFQSQTNKTVQNHQSSHQKFHQSEVTSYQLNNIANTQSHKNLPFQSHPNKVVRPKIGPYNDMSQSRYSQKTQNQHFIDQDYLKKSSTSANNNVSYKNVNPNSMVTLQQQSQRSRINPTYQQVNQQSYTRVVPQSFIVHTPYENNLRQGQQRIQPYQNIPYHLLNNSPIIQHNQPIPYSHFLPPQQQFVQTPSFFPTNTQSQQIHRIRNQPFRNFNQSRSDLIPQNSNLIQSKPLSQNSNQKSVVKNLQSFHQNSTLRQSQNNQKQTQNKSKIKYFTTKDTYQLDDEIANDLEKFLGLKVK